MARYRYTALAEDGRKQKGTVEASTEVGARNTLVSEHLQIVKLRERRSFGEIEITKKRVKPGEIGAFSRQLAAFVRAGLPMLDGIETIAEEVRDKTFRGVLAEMAEHLRNGGSFSDAIEAHARHFPTYYPSIVESAEYSGNLADVLEQLADYIERDQKTRRRVKSALTYPVILLIMSLVVVVVLVGFVLPKFTEFFASFNAKLPLTTRMMIGLGDFVSANPIPLAAAMALLGAMIFMLTRTSAGAGVRHRLLLRTPIVRDVVKAAITERFCRILSAMLHSGVPIADGLMAAIDSCDNRMYERGLLEAAEQTLRGEGLAKPLARTGLLPPTVIQMVRVGEETGTLDRQLEVAADFYEDELSNRLDRMTTIFEPAVVIFMGLVVGFVAVALVSAMYGIYNQANLTGTGT